MFIKGLTVVNWRE